MIPDKDEKQMLHGLMLENQKLLVENNQLLKKMNSRSVWAFWLKIIWFMVLIGVPFALYYYVLEPYFSTFSTSVESFQDSVQQIPGLEKLLDAAKDSKGE